MQYPCCTSPCYQHACADEDSLSFLKTECGNFISQSMCVDIFSQDKLKYKFKYLMLVE